MERISVLQKGATFSSTHQCCKINKPADTALFLRELQKDVKDESHAQSHLRRNSVPQVGPIEEKMSLLDPDR